MGEAVGSIEYEASIDVTDVTKADKVIGRFAKNAANDFEMVDKKSRKLKTSLSSITKVIRKVPISHIAVAAGAAAVALVGMAKAIASTNKELEQFARLAGVSVDRIRSLAFATSAYGISGEQFADITKDMSDKLGEFSKVGTGPFQDYIDVMGLTTAEGKALAAQLAELSGPDAIQFLITEMEKAGVSGSQMTFVLESMGNDLSKLMPLFSSGGIELGKLEGRFSDLVGTLSADEIANFKEFGENFDLLTKSIGVFVGKVLAPMLPILNEATESLARFFRIAGSGKTVAELTAENEKLAKELEVVINKTTRSATSKRREIKAIQDQIAANNELIAQQQKIGDNTDDGAATEILVTEGASGWDMFVDQYKADVGEMTKDADRLGEKLGSATANISMNAVNQLSNGLANAIIEGESLNDVFAQVGKTILTEVLASFIRIGVQYGINAALGIAANNAVTANQVANNAAVAASAAPAAALQSTASFGTAAVIGGAALLATLAIAKSAGGGKRTGGHVSSGMMHEVGESGAEMLRMGNKNYLIPGRNGEIISNDDLSGGGSNVTVNVINNVSDQVEAQVTTSDNGNTVNITLDDVANDIRNRGTVFNAITNSTTAQNRAGR